MIEKEKPPKSNAFKSLKSRHPFLVEESFGVAVRKGAYQTIRMVLRDAYYVKHTERPGCLAEPGSGAPLAQIDSGG